MKNENADRFTVSNTIFAAVGVFVAILTLLSTLGLAKFLRKRRKRASRTLQNHETTHPCIMTSESQYEYPYRPNLRVYSFRQSTTVHVDFVIQGSGHSRWGV
ncbi:hypothetical protein DFP73DRAFT_634457 [Morchella snyderi]|nr:hypothetical protein DFP73DRAFT_634457 [Morchella snyderi]